MLEMFYEMPEDKLGIMVGMLAIVMGCLTGMTAIVASQWRKFRRDELEIALKQDLVNQGRTPEEIRTIIEATAEKDYWSLQHAKACRE